MKIRTPNLAIQSIGAKLNGMALKAAGKEYNALVDRSEELEAENRELKEYTQHEDTCGSLRHFSNACDCGLYKLLKL